MKKVFETKKIRLFQIIIMIYVRFLIRLMRKNMKFMLFECGRFLKRIAAKSRENGTKTTKYLDEIILRNHLINNNN